MFVDELGRLLAKFLFEEALVDGASNQLRLEMSKVFETYTKAKRHLWVRVCRFDEVKSSGLDLSELSSMILTEFPDLPGQWDLVIRECAGSSVRVLGPEKVIDFKENGNLDAIKMVEKPKLNHRHWKGGDLKQWCEWVDHFTNLADEYSYNNDKAMRRLKEFVALSPDSSIIKVCSKRGWSWLKCIESVTNIKTTTKKGSSKRKLSDIKQGKNSVETYLSEFLGHVDELERTRDRKFEQIELIEAFEENLWSAIKDKLAVLEFKRENFMDWVLEILELEGNILRLRSQRPGGSFGNAPGNNSKKSHMNQKNGRNGFKGKRLCYSFRDTGSCRRGDRCQFEHVNVNQACRHGDSCERHKNGNCWFKHNVSTGTNESDEKKESILGTTFINLTLSNREKKCADDNAMYLDSCSSIHINDELSDFEEITYYDKPDYTIVGGEHKMEIIGEGIVWIDSSSNEFGEPIKVKMYYSPKFGAKLLSQGLLFRKGVSIRGSGDCVELFFGRKRMMTAHLLQDDIFKLDVEVVRKRSSPVVYLNMNRSDKEREEARSLLTLWHRRLDHADSRVILTMAHRDMAIGLEQLRRIPFTVVDEIICDSCMLAKQLQKKISLNLKPREAPNAEMDVAEEKLPVGNISTAPIVRIASDSCGPLKTSVFGNQYFSVRVVKGIGLQDVCVHADRADQSEKLKKFFQFLRGYGRRVVELTADLGGEQINTNVRTFGREQGINLRTSPGYDSNVNPHAERANRTILDDCRCVLIEMNVPRELWDEAVLRVVHTRNRLWSRHSALIPTVAIGMDKPDFSKWKVFGCLCYARRKIRDPAGKLIERNVKSVNIGYGVTEESMNEEVVGYRLFDFERHDIFYSRKVSFFEEHACYEGGDIDEDIFEEECYDMGLEYQPTSENESSDESEIPETDDENPKSSEPSAIVSRGEKRGLSDHASNIYRMLRIKRHRSKMTLFREKNGEHWKSLLVVSMDRARQSGHWPEWEKAMKAELAQIELMNTFDLCQLPKIEGVSDVKVFKSRFVLDWKEFEKRFKARIVVQAYNWYPSFTDEFFSPVVADITMMMFWNLVTYHSWKCIAMDAKNAFLNGVIPEGYEIYVYPPKELKYKYGNKVWRLKKALYGLPIASKLWYEEIHKVLVQINCKRSKFDPCLWYKLNDLKKIVLMVIVHVDDFMVAGENRQLACVAQTLSDAFTMKIITKFNRHLSVNFEFAKNGKEVYLDQIDYIDKLVEQYMGDRKPNKMPYKYDVMKLEKGNLSDATDGMDYKALIGSLLYVLKTRRELKFILSFLASFVDCWSEPIYEAAVDVVRYLAYTREYKLVIGDHSGSLNLAVFADAGFANDGDRKSRTGMLFKLDNSYLDSDSNKQTAMSTSTTEAEIVALTSAAQKTKFLRMFLAELGYAQERATVIFQDNSSAIRIVRSDKVRQRSRHFDVKFLFVRELEDLNKIILKKCGTAEMMADALTKPVGKAVFYAFRTYSGIRLFHKGSAHRHIDGVVQQPEMT